MLAIIFPLKIPDAEMHGLWFQLSFWSKLSQEYIDLIILFIN